MEILSSVPDELFSDSLGINDDLGSTQQEFSDAAISLVVDDLIDNVIFGFCLEIHRMTKKGILFLEDTDLESIQQFKIVDTPGLDIFGQELVKKKALECVCPHCERNMAASRFAPHLERCMGMGRCTSRVASRRIANNINKQEGSDNDSLGGDDHDDWAVNKRTKKLKREKHNNSPRGRGRPPKQARQEAAGELDLQTLLVTMDGEQRKSVLTNICAAFTDVSSKKLCTRALKCPLHTDDQRHASRLALLPPVETKSAKLVIPTASSSSQSASAASAALPEDEVDIDIDTFDDLDSQTLREALWDKDLTPTASPADSTSTVNSSGSRKRGRKKKSKRGRD